MRRFPTLLMATALTATMGLTAMQPALADGAASTRNIILGAAALVAGVATEANVAHKDALASTVQGYTPDGSAVYEDGHVVLPDGQSYYPGNQGQSIACNDGACSISGGYDGYGGYHRGFQQPGHDR